MASFLDKLNLEWSHWKVTLVVLLASFLLTQSMRDSVMLALVEFGANTVLGSKCAAASTST